MVEIDFAGIEKKWQDKWEKEKIFETSEKSKKSKYYVLEMFPYPSGEGIHMGHAFNYVLGDIVARFKKMSGFNVMHPMGFDSLGLPAENAAIKKGVHPEEYTDSNIPNFVKQQKGLGISYDWDRVLSTHDSKYYRWDQWIFLKMLEKGLAYQKTSAVNWCKKCNTVLANEQVSDGKCWRHDDTEVEVRHLKQWFLKTTEYADELYENLDKMDWPDKTKAMQRNWIGKSHGTEIDFLVEGEKWPVFTTRPDTIFGVTFMVVSAQHPKLDSLVTKEQRKDVDKFLKKIKSVSQKSMKDVEALDKEGVFTGSYAVNPATGEKVPVWAGNFVVADYGAGMVMAVPAHDGRDFEFAKKYDIPIKQVVAPSFLDEDNPPRKDAKDTERNIIHAIVLDKRGENFIALRNKKHPWLTPVTGGIEDGENIVEAAEREIREETGYQDFSLERRMPYQMHAKFYAAHKKVNRSVMSNFLMFKLNSEKRKALFKEEDETHAVEWLPISKLDTLHPVGELPEILKWFNEDYGAYTNSGILIGSGEFDGVDNVEAKKKITAWLEKKKAARSVVNFKLRDWGVSRQRYWGTPIPVIHCEKCGVSGVPEKDLPVVLPREVKFGDGNPLETNEKWLNVKCPKCGGKGRRESDTMDTFVNSSWYFMRYCDPKNDKVIFDTKKVNYWCPVDTYIGGAEHACMHLIYSRFYVKFLRDLGLIDFNEPAVKLLHQGMINGSDGEKMSKSKGNGVEPLETMKKYGVDTTRFFLVSVAAPDKGFDWSDKGINGALRFTRKIFEFYNGFSEGKDSEELASRLNLLIRNVSGYYDNFEYRKATIELREFFGLMENGCSKEIALKFLQVLAPICPHIAEEFWEKLGGKGFICESSWPKVDSKAVVKLGGDIDLNGKIIENVKYLLGKTKDKVGKIYIYVMPFEVGKIDVSKIGKAVGKRVKVFAVNDSGKVDPENKAKKAKPGMPAIYFQ